MCNINEIDIRVNIEPVLSTKPHFSEKRFKTAITNQFIQKHGLDKLSFSQPLTKRLYNQILTDTLEDINQIVVPSLSKEKCLLAFTDQEPRYGLNIISCAAFLNKIKSVELILQIPFNILRSVFEQKDHKQWTPLHHLALLPDQGQLYKRAKAILGINSKTHTTFYCESASMMRRMLKKKTKLCRSMGIYFRDGSPAYKYEERLSLEDLKEKYSSQFTKPPKYFRLIPYANRVFFQRFWISKKPIVTEDVTKSRLDNYLIRIEQAKGDEGLALTTTLYDDNGNSLEKYKNLGLGVEARKSFGSGQIVSLWAGKTVIGEDLCAHEPDYTITTKKWWKYYKFDYIFEGLKYRSFGSNVQHSFPNIEVNLVMTCLSPLLVNFAINEIKPNTQICYYYKKESGYAEMRPNAMYASGNDCSLL